MAQTGSRNVRSMGGATLNDSSACETHPPHPWRGRRPPRGAELSDDGFHDLPPRMAGRVAYPLLYTDASRLSSLDASLESAELASSLEASLESAELESSEEPSSRTSSRMPS